MAVAGARTGVCVIRVEDQAHGVLITLRLDADLARDGPGVTTATADAETALRIVREFLLTFLAGAPGS